MERNPQQAILKEIAGAYVHAHPDQVKPVKFDSITDGTHVSAVTTQMSGGDAPDLIRATEAYADTFVSSGVFADLGPKLRATKGYDIADLTPGSMKLWKDGDAIYAHPFSTSPFGVCVNNDLLKRAKQPDPRDLVADGDWTWDRLAGIAAATARSRHTGGIQLSVDKPYTLPNDAILPIGMAWGARPWSADGRKCAYTSPQTEESDPGTALVTVVVIQVFKGFGMNMVLFPAALQGVPPELKEPARLDGASAWRSFRSVTIPLIAPTILLVRFYEAHGFDFGYDFSVELPDPGELYDRIGEPGLAEQAVKWADFFQYAVVREPGAPGFIRMGAFASRTNAGAPLFDVVDGEDDRHAFANAFLAAQPKLAAFLTSREDRDAGRTAWAASAGPITPRAEQDTSPRLWTHVPRAPQGPAAAQKESALARLSYLRSSRFTRLRAADSPAMRFVFVRRPRYYTGALFGQRASSFVRTGLQMLWHPVTGTVAVGLNAGAGDGHWSTVLDAGGQDTAAMLTAAFSDTAGSPIAEADVDAVTGTFRIDQTPEGVPVRTTTTFSDTAVRRRVTADGAATEIVPLVLQPGDALAFTGSSDAVPYSHAASATATGFTVRRGGVTATFSWGTARAAALVPTSRTFFGDAARRQHVLRVAHPAPSTSRSRSPRSIPGTFSAVPAGVEPRRPPGRESARKGGMLPAQPNRSLMDGLACLQALATSEGPVGTRELARRLGLEPTRAHRLLRTLASMGLAAQNEQRKYLPGAAIHVLAAQSLQGSGLIDVALPHLRGLHDFGHAVALGVLWRDQVSYLYHVGTDRPAEHVLQGGPYPATVSGIGIALLACQPEQQVRELYAPTEPFRFLLTSQPPRLDGPDGLFALLRRTRSQGYALVDTDPGRRTLAAPVGDPPYAAVGVSGTFGDDEVPRLRAAVLDVAEKIHAARVQ